ncbi:unnamed protein product, partial [Didymodactylos carnosus]
DLSAAQVAHALITVGNEKSTLISQEITKVMKEVSKIQQKRKHTAHVQSNKKQKLAQEQSKNNSDQKNIP